MRRDSDFGLPVHVSRADLDFRRLFPECLEHADDGRMERLVAVFLRKRDIILETLRNRSPRVMDDSENFVTMGYLFGNYAEGEEVVNVFYALVALPLHLLVNAERRFYAERNIDNGDGLRNEFANHVLRFRHEGFLFDLQFRQFGRNAGVIFGIHDAETLGFESLLEIEDTETVGNGRVDVERFERDSPAFFGIRMVIERRHIMKTVGQFHENHAHVFAHRDEHFAQTSHVPVFVAVFELGEFFHARNDVRDVVSEFFFDVVYGLLGILGNVMEETALQRDDVGLQLRKNPRGFSRMGNVRVSGFSVLSFMGVPGVRVRPADFILHGVRIHSFHVALRDRDDIGNDTLHGSVFRVVGNENGGISHGRL